MKKTVLIIIGVVVLSVVVLIGSLVGNYNSVISLEEKVNSTFADIDVQLERRGDLIPNLVNTVKGYAVHEEQIITEISNARAALSGATTVEEKAEANSQLDSAISRLMVIVENYPDLKANTNFINLQDELAGTENRIAVARRDYNEVVKEYNTSIKKFPTVLFAGMFGFEEKQYFEVSEENKEAPEVNFN